MPRGKYVNHKGRLREFTPVDILEMELVRIHQEADPEEDAKEANSDEPEFDVEDDYNYDYDYHRNRGIGRLIEISNPNRLPRSKPLSVLIKVTSPRSQQGQEEDPTKKWRRERKRERKQTENLLRSKESVADLARLALVRKEREAAAQRRLAAKQPAAEAASSSSLFSKKVGPKSSEDSGADFLARNPRACQPKIRSARKK
ncbi:28 kDa heat- and acid-stable phosphoprotein-like [Drosophila biarmipes]|uniref:28 kDa heat- and acid-stable phosphoprotein-like n=1 Tax=Drosophila biarmipes TaxID=125945 RepID=UPI0007E617EC|nr:28 kDa heat- and acid-stable phosphoprotein-like [Drosophila biarmipes]XP_050743373.1 28 kDa heat- and acid-stable phosphoprotein-like [Drosophila biarmipes]XP_050743374.1 28 kDa heat- and acid-stable phosphoprotein-like [Drosophila biarmipes]